MNMVDKIVHLWPEITLLIAASVVMILGLVPSLAIRRATAWIAGVALVIAGVLSYTDPRNASGIDIVTYVKIATCLVGLILLLVAAGVPDQLRFTRDAETHEPARGRFEPADVMRGEFYAFFLFSLTGVMLAAGASDLVWLFLALELVSLPTYVMVATGRDRVEAQESAVKYFFLGAMGAAVFLYGFTLIYGATGQTEFGLIRDAAEAQVAAGGLSALLVTGLVLSVVGIAFKIAAFPMHFYAADVYQGAATPVTAFLAFVPKTAGFVAIMLLFTLVPALPDEVVWLLWAMAAITMTVGNVLGLLQSNVKRVLAYSSIAHTGYMLVGLVAMRDYGRPAADAAHAGSPIGDGGAAVLFYLLAYGFSTIAAFAVLGCLTARGEEAEEFDDISGLNKRHPFLAAVMLVAVLSLIGLPPLAGFLGKIYLFGSAISHGFIWLVVIGVINSAISAVYYLRIASACYFGEDTGAATGRTRTGGVARPLGAALAALLAIAFGLTPANWLIKTARRANENSQQAIDRDNAPARGSVVVNDRE